MQVTETTNEGLRLEFTVVVPKTDVESRMTVRLNEVGTSVNVPGFRPGKVPLSVLKNGLVKLCGEKCWNRPSRLRSRQR